MNSSDLVTNRMQKFFPFVLFYLIFFILHSNPSSPSLSFCNPHSPSTYPIYSSEGVRTLLGSQQTLAYQAEGRLSPSPCIKTEQSISPRGMSFKKPVHSPGISPSAFVLWGNLFNSITWPIKFFFKVTLVKNKFLVI